MASSQHGSEVDLQKRSLSSSSQVLVHMTVHVDQYFSTLFGMQTHFQNTQRSVAHLCIKIPSCSLPNFDAVAHRLRTTVLDEIQCFPNKKAITCNFRLVVLQNT